MENSLEKILKNAKTAGVEKIISVGVGAESSRKCVEISEKFSDEKSEKFPAVFATAGIHPTEIPDEKVLKSEIAAIEKLAENSKIVALGEFGFDFARPENPPENLQIAAFEAQLNLARKLRKPIIFHFRDAQNLVRKFWREIRGTKFLVHCFSGSKKFADEIRENGGAISLGGILTFPNAKSLREIAADFPLEKIVLETDAPFLAPQKFRGKLCEPAHIFEIAEKLAAVKNLPVEKIAEKTTQNAENFFEI